MAKRVTDEWLARTCHPYSTTYDSTNITTYDSTNMTRMTVLQLWPRIGERGGQLLFATPPPRSRRTQRSGHVRMRVCQKRRVCEINLRMCVCVCVCVRAEGKLRTCTCTCARWRVRGPAGTGSVGDGVGEG